MESTMKWYVLRVLNGHERKIKEYLEKEISRSDLQKFVKRVIVAVEKAIQTRKGKKIAVDKILYPGYVFIQADLNGEVIPAIKAIPGVSGFVAPKGGAPSAMSDEEVRNLLRTIDDFHEAAEAFSTEFHEGDSVVIAYGPFDGFNGVIEAINKERHTVKVNVKIFGRITPVEIALEHIERA